MALRAVLLFATIVFLATSSRAQDPLVIAPQAYKLEFENDWVKVTRVHYAAHAKIPTHNHTETGAAYVYLNDVGPVLFRHVGASYGAITRPATKAGSFRLYRAVKETHEVENPNDTASDFMRVEFKTTEDPAVPLRGKFFRETSTEGESFQKIQFENAQVRITRFVCAKQKPCDFSTTSTEPALLISLTPVQLEGWGQGEKSLLAAGKAIWIDAGKKQILRNLTDPPVELLRFELKAKPVKSEK